MIVSVEGVSASGKTTWCRAHYGAQMLPEHPPPPEAPDRDVRPLEAARFWLTADTERWRAAERASSGGRLVVCDTDPFKLHYAWTLWRIGEASKSAWLEEARLARHAFATGDLGLVDLVLIADLPEQIVRARRNADSTRGRRHFELHVRLIGPLREWYEAVATVDERRVIWGLPEGGLTADHLVLGSRQARGGLDLFDAVIAGLPGSRANGSTASAAGATAESVSRIEIVDYEPRWPQAFEDIRSEVAGCLGSLATRVEHVGSTAVPGLPAKPILDVDVLLAEVDSLGEAVLRLARIGYRHEGDLGIKGREAFEPPGHLARHHLYVCLPGVAEFGRHVAFRDALRSNPKTAELYAELKKDLAVRFPHDRVGYSEGKTEFIEAVLESVHAASRQAGPRRSGKAMRPTQPQDESAKS